MIGFIVLTLIFLAMIFSCYVWGIHELRHPKDEGPFFIDLSRKIVERITAFELRKNLLALKGEADGWKELIKEDKPDWLKDTRVSSKKLIIDGIEICDVWLVLGNVIAPKETVFNKILMVWGSFRTEEKCSFEREVYAAGECIIGKKNRLCSITTHKSLVIGEETVIEGYADSNDSMYVKNGSRIAGLAASKKTIFADEGCSFGVLYSKMGVTSVADSEELIKTNRSTERLKMLLTSTLQDKNRLRGK
ncbi:MAG: hypothetical protein ACOWW1_09935 [archaeon]